MAKGYPDFFGFSFFPYYGGHNVGEINTSVPGQGNADVLDLRIKGILLYGFFRITWYDAGQNVQVKLTVDGINIFELNVTQNYLNYRDEGSMTPLVTVLNSYEKKMTVLAIDRGISFNEQFTINIWNTAPVSGCNNVGKMFYAQIKT